MESFQKAEVTHFDEQGMNLIRAIASSRKNDIFSTENLNNFKAYPGAETLFVLEGGHIVALRPKALTAIITARMQIDRL